MKTITDEASFHAKLSCLLNNLADEQRNFSLEDIRKQQNVSNINELYGAMGVRTMVFNLLFIDNIRHSPSIRYLNDEENLKINEVFRTSWNFADTALNILEEETKALILPAGTFFRDMRFLLLKSMSGPE